MQTRKPRQHASPPRWLADLSPLVVEAFDADYNYAQDHWRALAANSESQLPSPSRSGREYLAIGYWMALQHWAPDAMNGHAPEAATAIDGAKLCGICGAPMRAVTENRKSGKVISYNQCTARTKHPKKVKAPIL